MLTVIPRTMCNWEYSYSFINKTFDLCLRIHCAKSMRNPCLVKAKATITSSPFADEQFYCCKNLWDRCAWWVSVYKLFIVDCTERHFCRKLMHGVSYIMSHGVWKGRWILTGSSFLILNTFRIMIILIFCDHFVHWSAEKKFMWLLSH